MISSTVLVGSGLLPTYDMLRALKMVTFLGGNLQPLPGEALFIYLFFFMNQKGRGKVSGMAVPDNLHPNQKMFDT